MATITKVKGCPWCGGSLYGEKDSYGAYVACMSCGRTSEPLIYNPPEPEREWVVHQAPTVRKANRDVREGHRKAAAYAIKPCEMEGCDDEARTRGRCNRHYKQLMRVTKRHQGVLL